MEVTNKTGLSSELLRKNLIMIFVIFFVLLALVFGSAGTIFWLNGWILIITFFCCICFNFIVLLKINPEVIKERSSIPKEAKKWDIVLVSLWTIAVLSSLVISGLDEKYQWSKFISGYWIYFGIVLVILGDFFVLWAMVVNRWFTKVVAVQSDRGHQVITSGPYQYVRHPGYVGAVAIWIGTPLILGSLWAFLPVLISTLILVIRTKWEDDTLQEELAGYKNYAAKVKYRLIPGVW